MAEENLKPFNAHQDWERGLEELLKWQEATGITLLQIRDPDGMKTFDEDGNRVRQYDLRSFNMIKERLRNDPLFFESPEQAAERAGNWMFDLLMAESESVISSKQLKGELEDFLAKCIKEIDGDPTKAASIKEKLAKMSEARDTLPDADKVRKFLSSGESKTIEFKESLSLDVRKQTKESYIEESSLKTIAAFLNTDGGALLIGISDDGQIHGVDREIEKFYQNADKFLLHFKNMLKSKIGEEFYPFIDYRLVKLNDVQILFVECKASQTPCYLSGKDFYVRTNPATDKLEGPKLVEYVKHHFR